MFDSFDGAFVVQLQLPVDCGWLVHWIVVAAIEAQDCS
jgi:hypothetical protein